MLDIKPGDAIRLHTQTGWKPAEYSQGHDLPRSHIVKAGELGHEFRRNRNRLMITAEEPHVITASLPSRYRIRRQPDSPRRILPPEQRERQQPTRPPDREAINTTPTMPTPQIITRSGRVVHKPAYVSDYKVYIIF